jgi:hypothetical protein
MKPKPNAPKEVKKVTIFIKACCNSEFILKIKPLNSNDSDACLCGKTILVR